MFTPQITVHTREISLAICFSLLSLSIHFQRLKEGYIDLFGVATLRRNSAMYPRWSGAVAYDV